MSSDFKEHDEQKNLMFIQDEILARELFEKELEDQDEIKDDTKKKGTLSLPQDTVLKYDDPNPDIHELFMMFNAMYFWRKLDGIEVRWSTRMTLCAGMCYYFKGGYCSVRLSEPLLKFRPRDDMIDTLLHEMIHAYLFVTVNNRDRDGHGPEFHKHMHRINKAAGTKITVFHSFHDEVNHYRVHAWKCNGPCQRRPPYYGIVKRSMNRPPQPADRWWTEHLQTCGGTYSKIAGPEFDENPKKPNSSMSSRKRKAKTIKSKADNDEIGNSNDNTKRNVLYSKNSDSTDDLSKVKKEKTLDEMFSKIYDTKPSYTDDKISSSVSSTQSNWLSSIPVDGQSDLNTLKGTPRGMPPRHLQNSSSQSLSSTSILSTTIETCAQKNQILNDNKTFVYNPKQKPKRVILSLDSSPESPLKDEEFSRTSTSSPVIVSTSSKPTIVCPVCKVPGFIGENINRHLDECLNSSFI